MTSQVVQLVKTLPAYAGDIKDMSLIPCLGRSPGVKNGSLLQYLAWRIARTEETGGLQSIGLQGVRHN